MYSYYTLTILGYKIWWKNYLTLMQIAQFILILLQYMVAWHKGRDCGVPDFLKAMGISYMLSMLILFRGFYLKTYRTASARAAKKAD